MRSDINSIAIGGFDGMHIAHQKLFENLTEHGALVVIETGYANLTPKKEREKYTKFPIFYFELSDIRHLSGKEFLHNLKTKFPNLKKIVVGYDFGFGANKAHNANDLKNIFDGEVTIVSEIKLENISVHSKIIRDLLKQGNIVLANKLLNKPYRIFGTKILGQGLGKKEFVPTINLDINGFLLPHEGIYATKTKVNSIWYNSVSFLGHRVSTDGSYAIETHIIDQEVLLKNNEVELSFFEKIRDNQKFENYEALKNQILEDIRTTKNYFANKDI